MIRVAIFDMDGLMVDSNPAISKAYETVLRENGVNPELGGSGIVHVPGISALDNWRVLSKKYDLHKDLHELARRKNQLQIEYLQSDVQPMPGLYRILELLQERGIKMAIASSSRLVVIELVISHLGINNYFDSVVSGEEVDNGKPAPDIFLMAAAKLGIPPAECVVFEDAPSGVRAAKAAGMKCVAVPSLPNAGIDDADLVLASLEDLSWDMFARLT